MKISKNHISIIAVISTLIIVFGIGLGSFLLNETYGWMVFVALPFVMGFLPSYIYSTKYLLTRKAALGLSTVTFILSVLCLLVFALEGLICIAMAAPFMILFQFLGVLIAFYVQSQKLAKESTLGLLILVSLVGIGADSIQQNDNLIPVKTSVTIDSDINTVWNHVVTFDTITTPQNLIFMTGISYPTHATIEGQGEGAIRYCNFSTGSFVEPITTWQEPNLLQFDVIEQPIPMNELNPFWEIQPPHLEGYFLSQKGQFELSILENGKIKLEGTTFYTLNLSPQIYWQQWSDFIIHKIHLRVLNHIKDEAENARKSN